MKRSISKATLRILDVKEIKRVPFVPMYHAFIERLMPLFDTAAMRCQTSADRRQSGLYHHRNRKVLGTACRPTSLDGFIRDENLR